MPAAFTECRVVDAEADAHRCLEAGSECGHQVAAGDAATLGDRQGGRNDLRRDVAQVGTVHVADRDGRDLVSIQEGSAEAREAAGPDCGGLITGAQGGRNRLDLGRLVSVPTRQGASDRVEQEMGGALANARRDRVSGQ